MRTLEAFFARYPLIRYRPAANGIVRLVGWLDFSAMTDGHPKLQDAYRLQINLAKPLDQALPQVFEVDGRIPQTSEHHVNPDGSLCLGSMLRQRLLLGTNPTLIDFIEKCVVPFLYAHSLREKGYPSFPFGELAHGNPGLIDDYRQIFGLSENICLQSFMRLLAMKRRRANKLPCYCGCERRFAACRQHGYLRAIKGTLTRLDIKRAYMQIWPKQRS